MSANTICLCGGEFGTLEFLVKHAHSQGHLLQCSCQRLFRSHQNLENHQRDAHSGAPSSFEILNLTHTSPTHAAPAASNICTICNKKLANEHGLAMHVQAVHQWSCPICLQDFNTQFQLEGHQRAAEHCYCTEHSVSFPTAEKLHRHLKRSLHVTGFECVACARAFKSAQALSDHLGSEGHARVEHAVQASAIAAARAASASAPRAFATPQEEAKLRCEDCNRTFKRIGALTKHKRSVKHNPLSDLRCPLSDECTQIFACPSALVFHLESGRCKSGVDRAKVNMIVHQHDTARHITSAQNIPGVIAAATTTELLSSSTELEAHFGALSIADGTNDLGRLMEVSDLDSSAGVPIFTPTASLASLSRTSSFSGGVPVLTPTASLHSLSRTSSFSGGIEFMHPSLIGAAREGLCINRVPITGSLNILPNAELDDPDAPQIYSCPVPDCEKLFKQQSSLVEHLDSPAHGPELYHCPSGLGFPDSRKPAKSFKTMSGILQHLEVGACAGGTGVLDQIFAMVETKIAAVTGTQVKLLKENVS